MPGENQTTFLGSYKNTLDTKGRVIVPAAFREKFPDGKLVLSLGKGISVALHTEEGFIPYRESIIKKLDPIEPEDLKQLRVFNKYTFEMEFDKQGRITIPPNLRKAVALLNEVEFLGMGSMIEILPAQEDDEDELIDFNNFLVKRNREEKAAKQHEE